MKPQIQFQSVGSFDGGAAMSFQAISHHQAVALFASSVKKKQGARKLPSSKSSSSSSASVQRSIFVQAEDDERNTPVVAKKISTKSSSDAHPPIPHQNTVGVLGGASAFSTLTFLEKLVLWSGKDGEGKDVFQEDSVPFIVCSDPSVKREVSLQSSKESSSCPLVVENLRRKRVFLEEGGAGCIVMPCHVSHAWFNEISDGCSLPFLNVAECVASDLKEANLKPLEAGSNVRIGVIATDAVLLAGFYQEKLQNQGFEVVLPDKANMERIVTPAINSLKRKDMEGAQNLLRIAIQMLLVRGVNVVILACDELQALLPQDDPLHKRCLDPIDVLARSAVRWARSAKGYRKNLNGA